RAVVIAAELNWANRARTIDAHYAHLLRANADQAKGATWQIHRLWLLPNLLADIVGINWYEGCAGVERQRRHPCGALSAAEGYVARNSLAQRQADALRAEALVTTVQAGPVVNLHLWQIDI